MDEQLELGLEAEGAPAGKVLPERMLAMLRVYGPAKGKDKTCGGCGHLQRHGHVVSTYFKCDLNRMSHGAATDWRSGWPACGKWRKLTAAERAPMF